VVSFTPQTFYLQFPLDRRLDGRYGQCGEEKNLLSLPGIDSSVVWSIV
jgi:hypothetical protein